MRELLQQRYAARQDVLSRLDEGWQQPPQATAAAIWPHEVPPISQVTSIQRVGCANSDSLHLLGAFGAAGGLLALLRMQAPLREDSLRKIAELESIYGLDLDASASHRMTEELRRRLGCAIRQRSSTPRNAAGA